MKQRGIVPARKVEWAFRREKVIFVLDRGKARAARELADRCRKLSTPQIEPDEVESEREWRTLQQEAAAMFADSGDARGPFDPKKRIDGR